MNTNCSNCGHILEVNTPLNPGNRPDEDSISICLYCGQICVFQEDLTLRKIKDEELAQIHPESLREIEAVLKYVKSRG